MRVCHHTYYSQLKHWIKVAGDHQVFRRLVIRLEEDFKRTLSRSDASLRQWRAKTPHCTLSQCCDAQAGHFMRVSSAVSSRKTWQLSLQWKQPGVSYLPMRHRSRPKQMRSLFMLVGSWGYPFSPSSALHWYVQVAASTQPLGPVSDRNDAPRLRETRVPRTLPAFLCAM